MAGQMHYPLGVVLQGLLLPLNHCLYFSLHARLELVRMELGRRPPPRRLRIYLRPKG